MGYNAYITRRTDWSDDDQPSITEAEWSAYFVSEPALASLYWAQGNVVAKNPDRALMQATIKYETGRVSYVSAHSYGAHQRADNQGTE